MKKKIWMSLGLAALAVFSLSACSTKNSDEAKKAFISDTVALNNSKDYNAQKVKLDVNEFKLHGKILLNSIKCFQKGPFKRKSWA
ncbi:hypothetical protein ICE98_03863 [Lactococcus lactis]|nr:hypothetical protein [Lactococcus lactis]